jgi:hypothetical protein
MLMATVHFPFAAADVESREYLVDALCAKAKHLDVVLTMLNSKDALGMLDEEGRSDAQWLLSDLAAEAANMARQIQGASAPA